MPTTLTILDAEKRQHKIRLSDIDGHETGQAFGERSMGRSAGGTVGSDESALRVVRPSQNAEENHKGNTV